MTYNDIIEGQPAEIVELTHTLRDLILGLDSAVEEEFLGGAKVRMVSFFIGNRNNVVAVVSPGGDHCKLYLHHTDKIDTTGIKLQGKGKHAKQVRITSLAEVDIPTYKRVLGQVVEVCKRKV